MGKLIGLEVTEETDTHIFFNIDVESSNVFGRKRVDNFNCYQDKRFGKFPQNKFMDNGESVFQKWLYMDGVINGILSTKSRSYKNK